MRKHTKRHSIKNGHARAVLIPHKGRFDLSFSGKAAGGLKGATAGVMTADGKDHIITLADCRLVADSHLESQLKALYHFDGSEIEITIEPAPRPSAFIITLTFTNKSRKDIPVSALVPVCCDRHTRLELGMRQSRLRVYRNGWFSGDVSRTMRLFEPHMENACDDAFWGDGEVEVRGLVRSAMMTQVRAKGFYLTAGFISGARQFGILSLAGRDEKSGPVFSAATLADGKPIAPKRAFASEPLFVSFAEDYAEGLADYASLLGERMEARRAPEEPSGWCSWYRYHDGVTEADCLENLQWLADNRSRVPANVFQIDDGWHSDIGDWVEDRAKFPRGMKALADDIRRAGFAPGLWFAPFIVSNTSKAFAEHPEWVVKNDDGAPCVVFRNWGKDLYALDLTNPYALGHVAEATGRICHDWGYDYIKIDFLPLAATRGNRRDDTKTRAQVMRRGLEMVRQNAGPHKYILGCGAPLASGVGIVDGMRMSMDVARQWKGDLSVLASSWALTRFWTHNSLWHNDPDCILLGGKDNGLSAVETRTLANMVLMSGGLPVVSEKMPELSDERIAMVSAIMRCGTTAGVPLDLFDKDRPSVYFAAGNRILLGVFNWDDEERTFSISPSATLGDVPASEMGDFWEGKFAPAPRKAFKVTLAAHESRVFEFK